VPGALLHTDPGYETVEAAREEHISGGRVVLGVGTGGVMHGTEAWEAVGVPHAERGRRTDEALALLPGLIRGETVELPSGASITLSPGADVPPILIGGNSPAALRRAVRHGAGWFSSVTTPQRVADGARRVPDTAQIAVGCIALLDTDTTDPRIDAFVAALTDSHGIPAEEAADVPITGTPTQAAERFAAYADAGATWLVLTAIGDDWHAQRELIAEAAHAARLTTDGARERADPLDQRAATRGPRRAGAELIELGLAARPALSPRRRRATGSRPAREPSDAPGRH
jgi:alkanesulfonate monooxygenase SsuD/methylene tetrahydromethanopterin reductase-like flavin-dependent oxidoreductase (luciferase family)